MVKSGNKTINSFPTNNNSSDNSDSDLNFLNREELIKEFNKNYERSLTLTVDSEEFERLLTENEELCERITGDQV